MKRCTAEQTGTLSAIRKNPSISPTRYFAQEGTALYYLNGDLKLITNDFESYEPYEGMLPEQWYCI